MYFDTVLICLFPWEICYILKLSLKQSFKREQRIRNILKANNTNQKNLDIITVNQQRKKEDITKTKTLSCKVKPFCQL